MPNENFPQRTYEFDPQENFGPGADLVSFPDSVQRKLDHAESLLRGGDVQQGLSVVHQAGLELARADPLLFAGLMAARLGVTGLSVTKASKTVRTVQTERFALGVRYAHDTQTTTDESFEERSVRFFGGGR